MRTKSSQESIVNVIRRGKITMTNILASEYFDIQYSNV